MGQQMLDHSTVPTPVILAWKVPSGTQHRRSCTPEETFQYALLTSCIAEQTSNAGHFHAELRVYTT